MMDVYTLTGKRITLKEPALSSGGEGAVYEIYGYPNKVAKIYHDLKEAKLREHKITEMGKISETFVFKSAQITNDIAWPLSPLYDKVHNFVGFGMNRISAVTELDDLYIYPAKNNINVTIENKIDCLISLCAVIDGLHQTGQVFGDFNPNNIKIKSDWTVSFVDADSYHVNSNGTVYPCIVCAPGYVAPEVIKACKGSTYEACKLSTFTKETDYFALAIHCFRMLMNGCHPYNCERHMKNIGSAPAPKSTDRRVEIGETPFFKVIPNFTVPHYAPSINSLPPYIVELFRKAFVDGHADPKKRPDAIEWRRALYKFKSELVQCDSSKAHYYWNGNLKCPYCEADERHSKKMFPFNRQASSSNAMSNNISGNGTALVAGNSSSSTYKAQKIAATQTPVTTTVSSGNAVWFWVITLAMSIAMLAIAAMELLPSCYWSCFEEPILVQIGVWGSVISGIVGSCIYNHYWVSVKKTGCYHWWDYLLSPLTAAGFVVGFGIAMALVLIVLYILVYILAFIFIIGIIIAFLSGG